MRVMMLSREIRRVPLDYDPPYRAGRGYQPVFDKFYDDALAEWQEEKRRWDAGERPSYLKSENEGMSFEEYHGEAPDPDYYYPGSAWPEDAEMAIRMYESVSEGTPISRPYPDTPAGRLAMANELVTQSTGITSDFSREEWLEVIEGQVVGTNIDTGEIVR